jgi:hypothetical protein
MSWQCRSVSQFVGPSAVMVGKNRAPGARGAIRPRLQSKPGPFPGTRSYSFWAMRKLGESSEGSSHCDHRVGVKDYYSVRNQLISTFMTPARWDTYLKPLCELVAELGWSRCQSIDGKYAQKENCVGHSDLSHPSGWPSRSFLVPDPLCCILQRRLRILFLRCTGQDMFQILEYLDIRNETLCSWDPSLTLKFISVSSTAYAYTLKIILENMFCTCVLTELIPWGQVMD